MRRLLVILVVLVTAAGVWTVVQRAPDLSAAVAPSWFTRMIYPLEHDGVIVSAAQKNDLDPALVAAVIYVESGFDARARSNQGAVGLMQVLPATAAQIAHETGGSAFVTSDLVDPAVNVRYGAYYLRSTIDQFEGDMVSAVAAYNAGGGAVSKWSAEAAAQGRGLDVSDIPYAETRAYVNEVMRVHDVYREAYPERLSGN